MQSTLTIINPAQKMLNLEIPFYEIRPSQRTDFLTYRLHQIWSHSKGHPVSKAHAFIKKFGLIEQNQLLDHCIKLAELDFELD